MPQIFGWQHLTYLAITISLSVLVIVLIKLFVRTEKGLSLTMRIIGGILLCCVIVNRFMISGHKGSYIYLIPDTYCGLSSFVLGLSLLFGKKNNIVFHFVCYVGFVGSVASLIYPDFLGQNESFMYPATITGLIHHSVMLMAITLMFITRYFVPTLKRFYVLPVGLAFMLVLGVFEIQVIGFPDAMQIKNPIIKGTILTWWFLASMLLLVAWATMAIYDYILIYRPKHLKKIEDNKPVE